MMCLLRGTTSGLVAACVLLFKASQAATSATLIIEHKGHEGAHAICETLGRFCLFPDCSERHDADRQESNRTDWAGIHAQNVTLTRFYDPDEEFQRLGSQEGLRDDDVVLILVRLDLMRWTLSLYWKFNDGKVDPQLREIYKDPQFRDEADIRAAMPPQHHDLDVVRDTALKLLELWRHKLRILDLLRQRNTTRYAIVTYEEFCDGDEAYLERVLSTVGVVPPCKGAGEIERDFEKVHSTDLHDFVANYEEIYRHFIYASYPTWGEIASEHKDAHV